MTSSSPSSPSSTHVQPASPVSAGGSVLPVVVAALVGMLLVYFVMSSRRR